MTNMKTHRNKNKHCKQLGSLTRKSGARALTSSGVMVDTFSITSFVFVIDFFHSGL